MERERKQRKLSASKVTDLTSSASELSMWHKNRSYFLRVCESRKKHRKSISPDKITKSPGESFPLTSDNCADWDKSAVADKLKEAQTTIINQTFEIDALREEIAKTHAVTKEQEDLRLKAQAHWENADKDTQLLKVNINRLRETLSGKETELLTLKDALRQSERELKLLHGEALEIEKLRKAVAKAQQFAKEEECLKKESVDGRKNAEKESQQRRITINKLREELKEKEAQVLTFEDLLDKSDQELKKLRDRQALLRISKSKQNGDAPFLPRPYSPMFSTFFRVFPTPLSFQYHTPEALQNLHCMPNTRIICEKMVVTTSEVACQVPLKEHSITYDIREKTIGFQTLATCINVSDIVAKPYHKKPNLINRITAFVAQMLLAAACLEYYDEEKVRIDWMVTNHVIPAGKRIFL